MTLHQSVASVKGVGEKKAKLMEKLGIMTVADLLYHIPRDYEAAGTRALIGDLSEGPVYTIAALITGEPKLKRIRNGLSIVTFSLSDESGATEAVFFNQPYIRRMYKNGEKVYVTGAVRRHGRRLSFTNPAMDRQPPSEDGPIPVYPLTAGLTQKSMRLIMRAALDECHISDSFPNSFRAAHKLAELAFALKNIHFPQGPQALEFAKRRLVFEELLLFSIALAQRDDETSRNAAALSADKESVQRFMSRLGFAPTSAQMRVMREIARDISQSKPMNRLLQGDVGSGKTTPAFFAMHICVQSGYQCVLMAPTEVLAAQHYAAARRIFCDVGINLELITGSTPSAQRRVICENIASGQTDIVIGTHALLYDNVQFAKLGLVITDEQHRFGVGQRAMLESKSRAPHTLIMSATPIPRTLALILYGDTNLSVIDEMPPGRMPVKTFCVPETKRDDMYGFLEKEISQGAQVFVICPLVEEGDAPDLRSSEQLFEEMSERFDTFNVALLHGRLKPHEKQDVMKKFKNKEYHILVSTTVIEVGVDVPSATVMVVENAERFGLAQLHQLRGRVGRGKKQSYCFLMSNGPNARLDILCKTNDGFQIAEEDLLLRGPGQFLGGRQSGGCDLFMAGLVKDMKMLNEARSVAQDLKKDDRSLYIHFAELSRKRFASKFDKTTIN